MIAANCGDPTPRFGEVNPSIPSGIYPEGTTVNFTCIHVTLVITGAESSTCINGSWSPQPPVCNTGK